MVVLGQAVKGGPVTVVVGTTKRANFPNEVTYLISPAGIDTTDGWGALHTPTTFRIVITQTPVDPADLTAFVGRISDVDLKAIMELRRMVPND